MKLPRRTFFPVLTALVLCLATEAQATDETYVFTPLYPPGDPFSGTIVLDSSSSTGGTIADIVSLSWSDNRYPNGVSTTDPSGICTVNGSFTWNADAITSMDIVSVSGYWYPSEGPYGGVWFPDWVVMAGGITDWVTTDYADGTWVGESTPAVSDRLTTLPVLFFLFGVLVSCRQISIRSLF